MWALFETWLKRNKGWLPSWEMKWLIFEMKPLEHNNLMPNSWPMLKTLLVYKSNSRRMKSVPNLMSRPTCRKRYSLQLIVILYLGLLIWWTDSKVASQATKEEGRAKSIRQGKEGCRWVTGSTIRKDADAGSQLPPFSPPPCQSYFRYSLVSSQPRISHEWHACWRGKG